MENFLCCFSLRFGALFIAWFTTILSSLTIILTVVVLLLASPLAYRWDRILIACGGVMSGMVLIAAIRVLFFFPHPTEQYDEDSKQVKSLKQLSMDYFYASAIYTTLISLTVFVVIQDNHYTKIDELFHNMTLIMTVPACFSVVPLWIYFGVAVRSFCNTIIVRYDVDERNILVSG